jgi:hypothetical protein
VNAIRFLVRRSHDERQGDIKSRNILVVELAEMLSNSFAPDRDGFVRHQRKATRFNPPSRTGHSIAGLDRSTAEIRRLED